MDSTTPASHLKRKPEKSVTRVVEALTELGMVGEDASGSTGCIDYEIIIFWINQDEAFFAAVEAANPPYSPRYLLVVACSSSFRVPGNSR